MALLLWPLTSRANVGSGSTGRQISSVSFGHFFSPPPPPDLPPGRLPPNRPSFGLAGSDGWLAGFPKPWVSSSTLRHHGEARPGVMTNHRRWALAIGVVVLTLLAPLANASASSKLKSTKTVLTISQADLGNSVDVQDWLATVRAAAAAPMARPVTFTLTSGGKVLATFTASVTNPDECTFTDTVTASRETVHATSPDRCSGGVAGYVILTFKEMASASTAVRARYPGAPGWASSCSGPVNPETVSPAKSGKSHSSTSPCAIG